MGWDEADGDGWRFVRLFQSYPVLSCPADAAASQFRENSELSLSCFCRAAAAGCCWMNCRERESLLRREKRQSQRREGSSGTSTFRVTTLWYRAEISYTDVRGESQGIVSPSSFSPLSVSLMTWYSYGRP